MAKNMAIRNLIFILIVLGSCSFNDQKKIENIEKMIDAFSKSLDEKPIKEIKRDEIKDIPYPLIEVRTNGILKQVVMLPLSERGGYFNYTSGEGQNLTKNGALISKTYGFNVGMISHKVDENSPFLILTEVSKWSSKTNHEYEFITPSFSSKRLSFQCKISRQKNVITVIMQKEFNTVKITENCLNGLTSFSNIYWATEDGFVWKSIQWLGNELSSDKDIYAEMYILKKNY